MTTRQKKRFGKTTLKTLRKANLLVLVVLCIAVLTFFLRSGSAAGIQSFALEAVSPLQRGIELAWSPVSGAWSWGRNLINAGDERARLQHEVDYLEGKVETLRAVEAENVRLRRALAIEERGRFPVGYSRKWGSVIARPSASSTTIVIDLGLQDGVSVDDAVIVPEGLVGRIIAASRNSSRVLLITEHASGVSATVAESNANGVVKALAAEGSSVMKMGFVPVKSKVSVGDLVVTSGWNTGKLKSIYPRGVPIGMVSSVGISTSDLYANIQVTPFADFDAMHEVAVLVPDDRQAVEIVMPPEVSAGKSPLKRGDVD